MFTLCAHVRSLLDRWKHAIYRDLVSGGGGGTPYTGKLRPKGVPFSGFRYIKG